MIPWQHLDKAEIPGGGGELRLMKRGDEFSIMLGSNELMNSRVTGSETVLGQLASARLSARNRPRLLIGGLGMGFTLRAALAGLGADASVVVAELVPAVIAWAKGPMAAVFAGSLSDPRVLVREADVGALIRSGRSTYDAILLDVDNGPEGLTRAANEGLYDRSGLEAARAALSPGGLLAVWSSAPDVKFSKRLRAAGFTVEEIGARSNRPGRGARHVVWIATRPDSSAG